jgi:hypothetical protein
LCVLNTYLDKALIVTSAILPLTTICKMERVKNTLKQGFSGGKKDKAEGAPGKGKPGGKGGQTQASQQPKTTQNVQKRTEKNQQKQVQSADQRPGNNSGLVNKKDSPHVQFGPVLKEFLGSRELVNKEIAIKFNQNLDKFDINLGFQEVLANGVSTAPQRTLPLGEYLVERAALLKKKDPALSFKGFVTHLFDRIGVDLTAAKPAVEFKSVERFVMKHLSPLEREIVKLSDDEYDRIDARKIPGMMEPTQKVIENHYGSLTKRTEFLLSQINSSTAVADREPPNWVLSGVSGISKGVLLESLKIQHVPKLSDEQKQMIDALSHQLFSGLDEEEEKVSSTSTGSVTPKPPKVHPPSPPRGKE